VWTLHRLMAVRTSCWGGSVHGGKHSHRKSICKLGRRLNFGGMVLPLGIHCTCNFCNLSVPQSGTFEIRWARFMRVGTILL